MKYLLQIILFFAAISVSYCQQDSTYVQDSIQIMDEEKEDKIINDIQEYSKKDNLLSKLLNNIMVNPSNKIDQWDYSYQQYDQYADKIIRDIEINTQEVFGPDPEDTTHQPNIIEKLGNFFHVKTRKWIVRNQLLFKQGEQLVPFQLAESERLLRSRDYLFDASIRVIPVGKDSVDLIVTTQDLWSLSPEFAWDGDNNSLELALRENNFLGFGFTTKAGFLFGDRFGPNGWDYEGAFRFENLFARYLHLDLIRTVDYLGTTHKISAERIFETPLIDIAGGINYNWYQKGINLITRDTVVLSDQKFRSQEYWLGYGTNLFNSAGIQNDYYIGASYQQIEYQHHNDEMIYHYYQDNSRFLLKAGYAFRKYKKTRFVIGLGRNEDIPNGQILTVTGGYVHGQRQNKWYAGIKGGYSLYREKVGYFSLIAEAGSFIYNRDLSEYTYRLDLLYFTNLYKIGRYRLRHFFRLEYAAIDQPRQLNDAVFLQNEQGIRGFNLNLFGNEKAVLNYEINLFPPLEFLGFNFAAVGFADVGFLANRNELLWEGRFFSGVGLGLKIRNKNLIYQSIQIMFGYYPQSVMNSSQFSLFSQQRDFYDFEKYRFEKPDIVRF